jgi:hypothetical protein
VSWFQSSFYVPANGHKDDAASHGLTVRLRFVNSHPVDS